MAIRILVVDDNEQNRYVMLRSLRNNKDWVVEECATGAEALERIKSHPDLVILDVRLPDVPGYEVCRRIKQNPSTRDIPVLQVSAYVGEQGKAAAREAGADGVLVHPLDPRVLVDVVNSLLVRRSAQGKS